MTQIKASIVAFALLTAVTGAAAAQDHAPPAPSKQLRRDMADALDKAAVCLRSERPIDECRTLIAMATASHDGKHCMMGMMDGPMMNKPGAKAPAAKAGERHEH